MLEDFKEPAPEGAELEAFLSAPKHHLARLIRDLFSEEASATTMEVSTQSGSLCAPIALKGWHAAVFSAGWKDLSVH